MKNQNDAKNRTLTLKRTFNVPVKLVWEAWTKPEHIAQWWGPKGMKTNIVEHNFKVGGKWKYVMAMPDGSEFIGEGVYSAIVALQKIFSSANFIPMTEGVEIQALFEEKMEIKPILLLTLFILRKNIAATRKWASIMDGVLTSDRLEGFVNSLNE